MEILPSRRSLAVVAGMKKRKTAVEHKTNKPYP